MKEKGLGQDTKVNVWDYKPWWCQPWSIVLTGITIVAGSWLVSHRLWISGLITIPIGVWWTYFLIIYPRAIADAHSSPD